MNENRIRARKQGKKDEEKESRKTKQGCIKVKKGMWKETRRHKRKQQQKRRRRETEVWGEGRMKHRGVKWEEVWRGGLRCEGRRWMIEELVSEFPLAVNSGHRLRLRFTEARTRGRRAAAGFPSDLPSSSSSSDLQRSLTPQTQMILSCKYFTF